MHEEHAGIARQLANPHQSLLLLRWRERQPDTEGIAAITPLDGDLAPLEAAQLLRLEAGGRLGRPGRQGEEDEQRKEQGGAHGMTVYV